MEYALRVMSKYFDKKAYAGLNPYSNGICSTSQAGMV